MMRKCSSFDSLVKNLNKDGLKYLSQDFEKCKEQLLKLRTKNISMFLNMKWKWWKIITVSI